MFDEFLYAASIIAERYERTPDNVPVIQHIVSTVILIYAHNDDEAVGRAVNFARSFYPIAEGYIGHEAVVLRPTAEHLLRGLGALSKLPLDKAIEP